MKPQDKPLPSMIQQPNGMELVGYFRCACVFYRPAEFEKSELIEECGFHKAARSSDAPSYLPGLELAKELLKKNGFDKSALAVDVQIRHLLTNSSLDTPPSASAPALDSMKCIFCGGRGHFTVSQETRALAERAVEFAENDTRSLEEKVKGAAKFIMGDEGAAPSNTAPNIDAILLGIDKTEIEHPDGWWETSTGAEFGAQKLAQLKAALSATTPSSSEDVPSGMSLAMAQALTTADIIRAELRGIPEAMESAAYLDPRLEYWAQVVRRVQELLPSRDTSADEAGIHQDHVTKGDV